MSAVSRKIFIARAPSRWSGQFTRDASQFTADEQVRVAIEQDLGDPRFTTLVVEYHGRVIGTATACSLEVSNGNTLMMRPPKCGFLGFAVVGPEGRGVGAGRALADAVLAWSRDQGYNWVATDWRSTNIEANRTWRAVGFKPSFYRLHRTISGSGEI